MSAQPSATAAASIRICRRVLFCLLAALSVKFSGLAQPADDLVSVTCVLDTYLPADSDRTTSAVILKVVKPTAFAGESLRVSESSRSNYEPGLLYTGEVRRYHIGHPGPGLFHLRFECAGLVQPLEPGTAEELGRLLRDRHWNEHHAAAIRRQFGDQMLFRVCYGFLTRPDRSRSGFGDQQAAAKLLMRHRNACEVSVSQAIQETFSLWDEALGEWPLYLVRTFGSEKVLSVLNELEATQLSERERERIEAWRYWAQGNQD